MLTNSDCSRRKDDENGGQSNFKKENKRNEGKKQNRQVIGLSNLLIEMRIHNGILAQVFQYSQEMKRQTKATKTVSILILIT